MMRPAELVQAIDADERQPAAQTRWRDAQPSQLLQFIGRRLASVRDQEYAIACIFEDERTGEATAYRVRLRDVHDEPAWLEYEIWIP